MTDLPETDVPTIDLPRIDLLSGLATTRTIRRYTSDPIPDDDLSTIMWHATRAPSGSNRQPARYLVLRDGPRAVQAKALLGTSFRAGWAAKRQADGYTTGSGADPGSPKSRAAATMQHYVDHIEQVPVVVLVCLVRYRDPSPYEGASVYPACQNLLLAARALGYGGALTGFHHAVEPELRQLLDIPDDAAMSACITLGRPAGSHGPVRRRPAAEVVFDDHWGDEAAWVVEPPDARHTSWRALGH
jgi:nitroreductase